MSQQPILLPREDDPTKLPADGAPPGFGEFRVPHVITFQSLLSNIAKVYRNPDQAWQHSRDNARLMRNDPAITEPLETRQRLTALLNWHLEAEDKDHPLAKPTIDILTRAIRLTPRFVEYRRNLMEAIWFGRSAIENRLRWKWTTRGKVLRVDKWTPYNGDKLAFPLMDGQQNPDELGTSAIIVGSRPSFAYSANTE